MRRWREHKNRLERLVSSDDPNAIDTIDTVAKKLPTPDAFPVRAMPRGSQQLIEESAAAIGCPPEFVALPMLAVLGSAIGNSRVLRLKDGWEEGASIFAAVIADPGEKKTPACKVAIEPAIKEQGSLREKYRRAVDGYKQEQRAYEVDKRKATQAGEPAPPPPQPPVMERTVVEDTTVEALASVLEGTPRGVIAVRDELTGWVRAMDQYKQGGKGADRQFYLSAWSSSYVAVDRKNRSEPLIITRPFISVFGSIQPSVLGELGAGREDGLLDRFLFAYPDPVPSRWTDAEISEDAREAYRRLYVALRDKHMAEDLVGDPEPVRVHLAPGAKDVLVDAIDTHREEMEAAGFPARLRGTWSKLEAYLARLCLILAASRCAYTGAAEKVEQSDVLAAVALIGYLKNHARRVYVGLYGENRDDLLAADVARFLRHRGGHFKDEPAVLFDGISSRAKPPRVDELTKRLKAIAAKSPALTVECGNFSKDGQSRRYVEVFLQNGVNGVKANNGA